MTHGQFSPTGTVDKHSVEVTNCFSVPHNESEDEVSGGLSCPCAGVAVILLGSPLGPPPHAVLCSSSMELLQFIEHRSVWTCFMCLFELVGGLLLFLSISSMDFWLLSFLFCFLRWLLTWNLLRICMNCTRKSLQMSSSWAGTLGCRGN